MAFEVYWNPDPAGPFAPADPTTRSPTLPSWAAALNQPQPAAPIQPKPVALNQPQPAAKTDGIEVATGSDGIEVATGSDGIEAAEVPSVRPSILHPSFP